MKLLEEYNKTAVLGFGRLNPPTIGHLKLVDTIKDTASTIGGEPMLYLSHSQDSKKNPLSYEEKVKWCKKAFGDVVKESNARTIVDVIKEVYNNGYTNLVYVGGEDRIGGEEDITKVLLKYNGQPNKSGEVLYNFDSIDFINAGNRNSSSNDLSERASASLARKLVQEGNFEEFKQIVPFKEDEAEELYNVLRKELGVENMKVEKLIDVLDEGWADFEGNVTKYLNNLFNDINEDLTEPIYFETAGANDSTESDIKCYYGNKLVFYIECKQTPANGGTFQLNCQTDANGGHPHFSPAKGRASQGIYSKAVNDIVAVLNSNNDIQSQFNANSKNRIQITDNKNVNGAKTIGINDPDALQNMRAVVEASYDKSTKNAPIVAANNKGSIVIGPLNSDIITVSNLTVRPKVDYVSNISVDDTRKAIIKKIIEAGYVDSPEDIIEYSRGGSKKDIKLLFASNKLNIGKNETTWGKIVLDDGTFFYITPSNVNPYSKDANFELLSNWVNKQTGSIFQIKKPSVRQAYMCDALLDINKDSNIVKNNSDSYVKKLIEDYIESYI